MELSHAIEAILFYHAEPLSVRRLSHLLKHSEGEVRSAIGTLRDRLDASGLRLIEANDEVVLGTSPDASTLIEAINKEELSKELSKASLETLSVVLYKGPVARAEIDYIRGVNSTFILRNLLIRGLIEKIDNPNDQRSYLYRPTLQLLEYMGVSNKEELPEYADTLAKLSAFVADKSTPGDDAMTADPSLKDANGEEAIDEGESNEDDASDLMGDDDLSQDDVLEDDQDDTQGNDTKEEEMKL